MDEGYVERSVRVLVLDDEPSIRTLCRVVLELEGFEVLEAESLTQAREALETSRVDVVVADLHLRGERSAELIAECHAREPRIPVILISGSMQSSGEAALDIDASLGKPFEMEELVACVRDLAATAERNARPDPGA